MQSIPQNEKCEGCFKADGCMLTSEMTKHCLGPFPDIETLLERVFGKEIPPTATVASITYANFSFKPGMQYVHHDLCSICDPDICAYSRFIEFKPTGQRFIGCKRHEMDLLCPFPCDDWLSR